MLFLDSLRVAQAAREKAIKDSLATARRDSLRLRRRTAIARNDSLYRNHGLMVSLEVGYNYQLVEPGEVIYQNYGYKTYGNTVPVEVDLLMGCRFCSAIAISLGGGLLYEVENLAAYGDVFSSDAYGVVNNYSNIDIPVFLNFKWFMSRTKVQPVLSMSGGLYLFSNTMLANAGFGLNIRASRGTNFYILGTAGLTPWPHFVDQSPLIYESPLTAGVKMGLAF